MNSQLWDQAVAPSQAAINAAFTDAMARVYLWMTGGLLLTTVVAMVVAMNPGIQQAIFSNSLTFFLLIGAQLGLVLMISFAINKLAPATALGSVANNGLVG